MNKATALRVLSLMREKRRDICSGRRREYDDTYTHARREEVALSCAIASLDRPAASAGTVGGVVGSLNEHG